MNYFQPNGVQQNSFSSELILLFFFKPASVICFDKCFNYNDSELYSAQILWQYNFYFIIWNKRNMRQDTRNQSTSYNYQQHNSNAHNMKLMPKSYTFESYLKSDFCSLLTQLPSIRKHFPLNQIKMKDIEYLKNNDKGKILFSYMKDFKVIDPAHT